MVPQGAGAQLHVLGAACALVGGKEEQLRRGSRQGARVRQSLLLQASCVNEDNEERPGQRYRTTAAAHFTHSMLAARTLAQQCGSCHVVKRRGEAAHQLQPVFKARWQGSCGGMGGAARASAVSGAADDTRLKHGRDEAAIGHGDSHGNVGAGAVRDALPVWGHTCSARCGRGEHERVQLNKLGARSRSEVTQPYPGRSWDRSARTDAGGARLRRTVQRAIHREGGRASTRRRRMKETHTGVGAQGVARRCLQPYVCPSWFPSPRGQERNAGVGAKASPTQAAPLPLLLLGITRRPPVKSTDC